jgi:serralysin
MSSSCLPGNTRAIRKEVANMNRKHFCFCPSKDEPVLNEAVAVKGIDLSTRAALLAAAKWEPGSQIRIRFLEGDQTLRERVEAVAKEWIGPEMANLTFRFVPSGDAEIRIAFQEGDGSWSYLGTQCKQAPDTEPTMNYGWLDKDSPESELRRVVLHEFGHALGLIHEHQNPNKAISWNKAAVIRDLSRPPNRWDPETIFNNIFKLYEKREILGTDIDPESIMMYQIPASWTTDGFSADLNNELSDVDKGLIREAYPWG